MSVKFKKSGFDELSKQLKQMERKAKELNNLKVDFKDMFTEKFMRENTSFSSLQEFADASGFDWSTTESFEAIPDDDMDKFVSSNSKFSSWSDMLNSAGTEFTARHLGF